MSYTSVLSVSGDPGLTVKYTFGDNTAKNVYEMGIDDLGNGQKPVAVFVTCETQAARWGFGASSPIAGSSGHVLASAGSVAIVGAAAVAKLKFCNSAAGSNAVLQITPFF